MTVRIVPNEKIDPTFHDAFLGEEYIGSLWFNPQMYLWFYQFDASTYRSANSKEAAVDGLLEIMKEWKYGTITGDTGPTA